ncbi:MAG TPA: HPr family phosphocarrier protein [Chthoniobacteraceae bacterium]|jgi:phosphocarrier protein HPr|nr:HPr family phosphocarrier protein [Chthoniobacteraceae bacterium]
MAFLSRRPDPVAKAKSTKELTVLNRLGLHARPSAMFVKVCSRFKSDVWVEKDGEQVNGKSIMGLMMLAAGLGSKLTITCEGADAEKALAEIEALILRKFDED